MAQKNSTKLYIGISLIAVLAIGLVGGWYLSSFMAPAATPGEVPLGSPIKIGVISPFTGPVALVGKQLRDNILLAYEELNATGQLPVYVDGQLRDIEFTFYDDKSDPEEGVRAWTDAFIKDDCDIVGWSLHSSVGLAVYKISTTYGKIGFASTGETVEIDKARLLDPNASKYWFKCVPPPDLYATYFVPAFEGAMDAANYTIKNKNVALLVEDTDYGRGAADALRPTFETRGWTITSRDVFTLTPPETDFSPLILKYKENNVSLVYMACTSAPSMIAFMKQSSEMQLKAFRTIIGIGYIPSDDWYTSTGAAGDYVLAYDSQTSTPEMEDWVDKFEAKYGYRTAEYPYIFWAVDHLKMLVQALRIAGTTDTETLWQTLLNMDFVDCISGMGIRYVAEPEGIPDVGYFMDEYADFNHFHKDLQQYMNGTAIGLYPLDKAQGTLQVPPGW